MVVSYTGAVPYNDVNTLVDRYAYAASLTLDAIDTAHDAMLGKLIAFCNFATSQGPMHMLRRKF